MTERGFCQVDSASEGEVTTSKDEGTPFSYVLPEQRIAQRPVVPYDRARLLVIDRANQSLRDADFSAAAAFLLPGDLLVFNDTKVLPARFLGLLEGEGQSADSTPVEVLLIAPDSSPARWRCIGKPLKKFKVGRTIRFAEGLSAGIVARPSSDEAVLEFSCGGDEHALKDAMQRVGSMPIPPYIRGGIADDEDKRDYQTIFAQHTGSIAAPTASLHFTPKLVASLAAQDIGVECLTLHVGAASIRPVVREGVLEKPQAERMVVSRALLDRIARTKEQGGRVIAVGTTVTRALESAARRMPSPSAGIEGETDLFITPGFRFKVIDGLFTNFHQPGTTHLLLVEAFMGRSLLEQSYAHALAQGYRFLSYGDGTLII